MDAEAHVAADPVNPMRIFSEFSAAGARRRDDHRRQRLGGELVRPAGADARRRCAASLSGTLATMGAGGALRDRRQVRPPGPAGDRLRGRRCDADERPRRAAHDRPLLARVDRPAARRRGAAQQRPQPGHLGAAGHGRHARGSSSRRRCPTSSYADFAASIGLGALTVTDPERPRRTRGRRRWPRTGRSCSTCTATPTCRRSRRTPPSSR